MKELLKDIRFVWYLILVGIAILLLVPRSSPGVIVTYAGKNPCGLKEGDVITEVNNKPVNDVDDFIKEVKNAIRLNLGEVPLKVNNRPVSCRLSNYTQLNVTIRKPAATNLHFSMDLEGGTRVFLKPETKNVTRLLMQEIIETINTRINLYGLKDMTVRTVGSDLIMIEMAGASGEEIRDFLSKQGKFEARIPILVKNKEVLSIGDEKVNVIVRNASVIINGTIYHIGDKFTLDDVSIELKNVTENQTAVFSALVFSGDDIVFVYSNYPDSGLIPKPNGYEFFFKVKISDEGAKRFAKVTKHLKILPSIGGQNYLESPINIYIDKQLVTSLRISADLAGKYVSEPAITGFRTRRVEAIKEMLRLQSILRSGSLPVKLEIVKIDTVSPTLGKSFLEGVIKLFIVSSGVVSILIFIFYRDWKIVVPIILMGLSEALLILGTAASQLYAALLLFGGFIVSIIKGDVKGWLAWVVSLFALMTVSAIIVQPWSLDIPAIAGLIAVAGTSVNQMIIIVDEFKREGLARQKEAEETSMHMVWSGFMLLVAVMSALIFMCVGTLKGLAITTILEEYIGTFITRPAFMSLLEKKFRK